MQLEEFIEQDIKEFLAEKARRAEDSAPPSQGGPPSKPAPQRSYQKRREEQIDQLKAQKEKKDKIVSELRNGLDRLENLLGKGDVVAAIYLYKHLKDLFREVPRRFNKERKQVYDQLITCYYQIKKASSKEDLEKAGMEQGNTRGGSSAQDTSPAQKRRGGVQENPSGQESEGDVTKEQVLGMMEEVKGLIRKKAAREAEEAYGRLKEAFRNMEDGEAENELLKDVMSIRKSLREMEDDEMERKQRAPPEDVVEKKEEDLGDRVNRAKLKAYRYLDNGEVKSAIIKYRELKELFEKIPTDKMDEKKRLKSEIVDLHDQILERKKENLRKSDNSGLDESSDCWDDIKRIKELVGQGKVSEAKEIFIDVQSKASQVPKEERKEIYKALDSVKSKLHLAHSAENMQRIKT